MDLVARAKELEAGGRDIVRLEIGDPDFPTPEAVRIAAETALGDGETGYTQSAGLPLLREAVSAHQRRMYGVNVDPEDIVVTQGTSPAMLLVFGALLDPGDEVIIPDPGYPAYPAYASFLGAVPVPVRLSACDGFRMRADDVEALITSRTRAIVVNSPANPTGAVLETGDLAALGALAQKTGVWLVSDEIYHGLAFGEPAGSVFEHTERAFVLNGFSKAFAMTGWRLGYVIAPRAFVRAIERLQQNFFLCANHFVQVAGAAALTLAHGDVARMRDVYDERRRFLVPALRGLGLDIACEPRGALHLRGRERVGRRFAAPQRQAARRGGRGRGSRYRFRVRRRGLPALQLRDGPRPVARGCRSPADLGERGARRCLDGRRPCARLKRRPTACGKGRSMSMDHSPSGVIRAFEDGEMVFHEGDDDASLYVVVSGTVDIRKEGGLVTTTIASFTAGDMFGELALIEQRLRSATAVAVGATEVEVYDRATFLDSLREDPELALRVMESLAGRLRETTDRLQEVCTQYVLDRADMALIERAVLASEIG